MFRNCSSRFILCCLFLFSIVFFLLSFQAGSPAAGSPSGFDRGYLPVVSLFWPLPTPTPGPGRLVISEVLYRPTGAEPQSEWIEILNAGGLPVELTGCKLGDAEQGAVDEGMYMFTDRSVVAPGQVLVVANSSRVFQETYGFLPDYEFSETDSQVPTLIKYRNWSVGSVNLGNTGDGVLLLDENDLVLDAVVWGNVVSDLLDPPVPNVAQGHSIARFPAYVDSDTAADWQDMAKPSPKAADFSTPTPIPLPSATPTATETPLPPLLVLLSEVYVHNTTTSPNPGDWVEIYNPGDKVVSLQTYKLGDEESQYTDEGMYHFPSGALLQPGEAIVVAARAQDFHAVYGLQPDFELEDSSAAVADMIAYKVWSSGRVNFSLMGDEVLLLEVNDSVMDAVSWHNSTWAFSPAVKLPGEGGSIARQPPNRDTNTASDWVKQTLPDPGRVTAPEITVTPSSTATLSDPAATATPSPTGTAGIQPSATSTFTPEATITPTEKPAATPTPTTAVSHLLLSEVLYHPVTERNAEEWIEIYNPTNTSWDLSGYGLGDEETFRGEEGMFRFPTGTNLLPGGRLVIAIEGLAFSNYYGCPPAFEIINTSEDIPDLVQDGIWGSDGTIYLTDDGDEVLLVDEGYQIIDVLVYGTGSYPGTIPHPGVDMGHSLERQPASHDTDDSSQDFIDQASPSPGQ